jgi:hypothetical protein
MTDAPAVVMTSEGCHELDRTHGPRFDVVRDGRELGSERCEERFSPLLDALAAPELRRAASKRSYGPLGGPPVLGRPRLPGATTSACRARVYR